MICEPSLKIPEALDIKLVSARAFFNLAKRRDHHGFLMTPRTNEKYLCTATTGAVQAADYDKFMKGGADYTVEELKQKVPEQYHSVLQVFMKDQANVLPPHRPEDHDIQLTEGSELPFARNYRPTNAPEAEVIKKYIDEHLGKGFIRSSSSPTAAPILVVRKPGGGLRVCIDYRALNEITIKNRYPIPLVTDTLSRLSRAKVFTKLDVVAAFNRIRIKEGKEYLTAFNTRYGQFEYLVMPFGLCNAPGTFQSYINKSVLDYLDVFCTAYLDDVLVYSEDPKDHTEHVLKVLQRLLDHGLHIDIDKCEFSVSKVKYLGLIVSTEGVSMDPNKVKAIQEWETPRSVKDTQAFTGFAGFYRRFIKGFSELTAPLNELTKGSETYTTASGKKKVRYPPFVWTSACEAAFEALKKAFSTAPILAHFDPDKETWVETDSSDFVTAGVLSQIHDGVLRPVAFFSKKMTPAETNYMIYDKELLAIIRSFETWRPELTSVPPESPVKVYSDHRNLEYFMTTKQLNRRQARWAEFLSEFNFKIMYRPGKQGEKPDILTRRRQDIPKGFDDDRERERLQVLINSDYLDKDIQKALSAMFCVTTRSATRQANHGVPSSEPPCNPSPGDEDSEAGVPELDHHGSSDSDSEWEPSEPTDNHEPPEGFDKGPDEAPEEAPEEGNEVSLETQLEEAYQKDQLVQEVMTAVNDGRRKLPPLVMSQGFRVPMGELSVHDNRLWVTNRLYIPENKPLRHRILQLHHCPRIAGHPGPKNLYRNLIRNYYWPKMKDDCLQFGDFCTLCRRSKARNIQKQGLLKPLPIPNRKWLDISMDLAEDLPPSTINGRTYRHVLIVVDRLTKQRIFEPLQTKEVNELVEVMHRRVFCEYGLPRSIVSDRGSAFTSYFWSRYCTRYGVKIKLSTAHHPETDGQSESAVKGLKNYLRSYINFTQDDWAQFLPDAQFAANNHTNESTGISPFFANHGYHPRDGTEPPGMFEPPPHPQMLEADKLVKRTEDINEFLQTELTWAQEAYTRHANQHRQPHPAYRIGDRVFVDARHFKLQRESQSLAPKNLGPWPIIRIIDHKAYEVKLPPQMEEAGVTPVFHPWKLHLASNDPYPGQVEDPEPPILIQDVEDEDPHEEWEIQEVVDCRLTRSGIQYKALFNGQWDDWNSNPPWQPWTDFKNARDKVMEYHQRHPEKPPPPNFFMS
jgi:hypothetical protein